MEFDNVWNWKDKINKKSGSSNQTFKIVHLPMKRALARLTLILQPPENLLVALCCISLLKPRPASSLAALGSAWSAPIARSSSYTSCSFSVVSLPPFPFSCSQGWKKPGFKKKQPSGVFWGFFLVFLYIFPEESFRVFLVSRILLGASRL